MRVTIAFSLSILCFLLVSSQCWAQKETSIWYFGYNAGLDFRSTPPKPLTDGMVSTMVGAASLCDADGNLLFYTDADQVFNRHHALMPNGTGLLGQANTAVHPTVIVPNPGHPNLYYVFTINPYNGPVAVGFAYATVDLSLQDGFGEVTSKQIALANPIVGVLTAVRHANGKDVWVIVHGYDNKDFYAYLVTEAGVNATPVISHIGSVHSSAFDKQMKASPDGSLIAVTLNDGTNIPSCPDKIEVFRFNSATGQLPERLLSGTCYSPGAFQYIRNPAGLEFSPSGLLLYFTNLDSSGFVLIYQLDLTAGSEAAMLASTLPIARPFYNLQEMMQLGPDGRIYIALGGGGSPDKLSVIEHPDIRGTDCRYVENELYLGGKQALIGLPIFNQSYFTLPPDIQLTNVCLPDSTLFTASNLGSIDSLRWDFGDALAGPANISRLAKPRHQYRHPGAYSVTLTTFLAGLVRQITRTIEIHSVPMLSLGADTTICSGESLRLTGGDWITYRWSTGETTPTIQVSQPGAYWLEVSNGACKNRDTVQVQVLPMPMKALGNDVITCTAPPLTLDAGNPGYQYAWSTGAESRTVEARQSGTYRVRISNGRCYQEDSIRVTFAGLYGLAADVQKDTLSYQEEARFFASGLGIKSWHWDFGDGTTASLSDPRHAFAEEGPYTVMLTAQNESGCEARQMVSVYQQPYLFIPNVFTPNFDGQNDLFSVVYNGSAPYHLTVFNRWGKEMFVSEDKHSLWDGSNATPGLFFYQLRIGVSYYNGWIHLLR